MIMPEPEDYSNLHFKPNSFENLPQEQASFLNLLKNTVYDFFDELPEGIKDEVNVLEKRDSKKRGIQEKAFYIDFDKNLGNKANKLSAQNPDAPFSLFSPNTLVRVGFLIQKGESVYALRIHGGLDNSEDFAETDDHRTVGQRGAEVTTLVIRTNNRSLDELKERLSSTLGNLVPHLATT